MKSHPIAPLVFLVTFSGVLIWQTGDDDQRAPRGMSYMPTSPVQGLTLAASGVAEARDTRHPSHRPKLAQGCCDEGSMTAPWAHPEVMHDLKMLGFNDDWAPAIARARTVIADDQDVQIEVGQLLVSRGDPVDGLAWLLLACMHCTQADERLGYGCAAAGLCDPNLAYVDVLRRDYGEAMVAEALARVWEIRAAIASKDPAALAPFTEINQGVP